LSGGSAIFHIPGNTSAKLALDSEIKERPIPDPSMLIQKEAHRPGLVAQRASRHSITHQQPHQTASTYAPRWWLRQSPRE